MQEKLKIFNLLCGDWDYRNIDMTEPHLQAIDITNNKINTSCELFAPDLDDYISCDSGDFNDKKLVKEFKELDLKSKEEVINFMNEIECLINWDKVNEDLRKQRRDVKILDTWTTDYDDLDYEAVLIEDGEEVARIIDGYDEATIRYNIGNNDSELTDEFCKKSLKLLTLDSFEELKNRPKISEASKLLQMLVDEVIASDSSMCFLEYDIWNDYIEDGTFKETDIDELKKEMNKYKLNDVIEFDCNEAKITAYGNLQYVFNDDRNFKNLKEEYQEKNVEEGVDDFEVC